MPKTEDNQTDNVHIIVSGETLSKIADRYHKGGNNITGSAGCQTFQPAEFNRFWGALGRQKRFQYVLCAVA